MESDSFHSLVNMISTDLSVYSDILNVIGALYAGKIIISFIWDTTKFFKHHLLPRIIYCVSKPLKQKYGEWAVVTGASEGIGFAYAYELAQRGMSVALIGRNVTKLENICSDIRSRYHVEARIILIDFNEGFPIYDNLKQALAGMDIGILVNNVGVISEKPMFFYEMSDRSVESHINVNVAACTMLTKIILPRMLIKKKGAIVNMASAAALTPIPLLSVYSATKAYADYWSQALQYECKGKNIFVQTLIPWYVNTRMVAYSKYLKRSVLVPTAQTYARHAVKTLGFAERTSGYWLHDLIIAFASWLPKRMWTFTAYWTNTYFSKNAHL